MMRGYFRFLWLLALLPLAVTGEEYGGIHARAVLDLSRPLLLRVENGERDTLLLKNARVLVMFQGMPRRVACAESVKLLKSVQSGTSRDVELLSLDRFAHCLNLGGYTLPAGAVPVEIGTTAVCEACVAGDEVVAIPFSVRFTLKRPGVIEEHRAFTNYLFFQRRKDKQPIRFSSG
jgi:hypothetical protein